MSVDENKNEDIICRKLINRVKENHNINIIATDKHWSYNKVILCNEREIHKSKYNKKNKTIVKKETIKKTYRIKPNEERYLDCHLHIMSKSETCLVESYNGSLRNTLARFKRKTRASNRSIVSIYNSIIIWMNKAKIMDKNISSEYFISIYANINHNINVDHDEYYNVECKVC